MRKGGGSHKGSNFEREICKQLSLWWSNNERDDCFWRTSGSGARFTVRSKIGKETNNSCGDLLYIDDKAKPFTDYFYVEIKRGYNLNIIKEVLTNKSKLLEWFNYAEKQRIEVGKRYTILIYKKDREDTLILFRVKLFNSFGYYCGSVISNIPAIEIHNKYDSLVLIRLKDLISSMSGDDIREVINSNIL